MSLSRLPRLAALLGARALPVPVRRSSIATWMSDAGPTPLALFSADSSLLNDDRACMRRAFCTAHRNGRRSIRRSRATCCDVSSRGFRAKQVSQRRRESVGAARSSHQRAAATPRTGSAIGGGDRIIDRGHAIAASAARFSQPPERSGSTKLDSSRGRAARSRRAASHAAP